MKEAGFPAFKLSVAVVLAGLVVGMAAVFICSARVGDCRTRDEAQCEYNSDQFVHGAIPLDERDLIETHESS